MSDREKKIAEIRKSAEEARKTKGSWVDGQDYADDVEFLLNEPERLQQENAQLRAEISRMKRGGWVSVKERLPENGRRVMVVDKNENQTVAWCDHGRFWPDNLQFSPSMITHWQPLPEPPDMEASGG